MVKAAVREEFLLSSVSWSRASQPATTPAAPAEDPRDPLSRTSWSLCRLSHCSCQWTIPCEPPAFKQSAHSPVSKA
ncbi:hypothetical protein MTO96_049970 [Rhipicephalus appendiculatus]